MASLPAVLNRTRREHPLIALGFIMSVLLAGLLALPFLARTRQPAAQTTGIGAARHS
jgi:hypothetical protein